MSMSDNNITYTAAAAANVVVTAKPAILESIVFGADVGSAVVEVSDSATDGDGNIQLYVAGDTLATSFGSFHIGAVFAHGITMDLTNQTHVTVIWRNIGS